MTSKRLVVLGTMAADPYAGMAWMHMQITLGLHRLGHDVTYVETSSNWPYDPVRRAKTCDSEYAVPYLHAVTDRFGLGDRWAYRRSYSDGAWLGPRAGEGPELLASADAVLNVAGSTWLSEDLLTAGNLVYLGTDPVYYEVTYHDGDPASRAIIDEHRLAVTYGENIGTPASPVPPLPNLVARTRQPIVVDLWDPEGPRHDRYTTVANWKQQGREVELRGERYLWSKDVEFCKFLDVPRRAGIVMELATNLSCRGDLHRAEGEAVRAEGAADEARSMLEANGWHPTSAESFTLDPWSYRAYVQASRAELSVARDLNVRLRSGWFSERSACYLAAGRPVVAQDTGFGTVLPTGEGLFAFSTSDEAVEAIERIEADYDRHRRAARAIAEEYFGAERVLAKLLRDLGV